MGQTTVDIEEEIKALKKIVGNCNDEIANLMAKNIELESKNIQLEAKLEEKLEAKLEAKTTHFKDKFLDAEKEISELQKLVVKSDSDDVVAMNHNAYTFMYTAPMRSGPFVAGSVTCLMQYAVFSLFLLDLLNTTKIPPDVAMIVRTCQIMAIVISFLVEADMLRALRAVMYKEGFEEMKNKFDGFTPWKFYAFNAFMGMQGLLGKVVAFFLIIFADNVFDLLLNFTAVMFVSELDEIVFLLSMAGFVGTKSEQLSKKIFKTNLPQKPPKGILRYLHIFVYGVTMVAAVVVFSFIASKQNSQESLAQYVKVQFGDEADPTLGLFSGCYEKKLQDGLDARVRYVQTKADRGHGDFEYCLKDGLQTWVFASETLETACEGNFVLRSAEERSTSFDLLDAKGDQWLLGTGNPISEFQLGEINADRFEIECGNIAINESATVSSSDELCPVLFVDADDAGFSATYDWSRTFVFLEDSNNEIVQFYQHPVFVAEDSSDPGSEEGYEVLFFTGRRWALANTLELSGAVTEDEVFTLFERSAFWLLDLNPESLVFLSEAVSAGNDRGTPLGLQWYNARYADDFVFPFADISRPVDASFRCGKCNDRTNPCLFEGICEADGTCACRHGASGKLCEIKPLGDGECNDYFNKKADGYDGGDCCVSTCSGSKCGVGDMNLAFGQKLKRKGTGFPNCTDPSMVPMSIRLQTEIFWDDIFFESYTVKVSCEGSTKTPLNVALDPLLAGKRNETIYLEDKAERCLLSFTGMRFSAGLNISFQVVDGLASSSDSTVVMVEETNITADEIFTIPALYSRCLKGALAGVIDQKHLYTGTYQDIAFEWLSNETRKLLKAGYYQVIIVSGNVCDGPRVVELKYDGGVNGILKGVLAPEFTLLRNLERLDLAVGYSQGTIPTEIGYLTGLSSLVMTFTARTGNIPLELFELTTLQELILMGNHLSGTVPKEIGQLSALTYLALGRNEFSGSIPSEVWNLSALSILSMFESGFSGSLPAEIGNLSGLMELSLEENAFSGTVPMEVWGLSSLETLGLSSNAFFGSIPSEVGNLSALISIDFQYNALSGTIPSEIGKLSFLELFYLYSNALSGPIPSEVGNLSAVRHVAFFSNALTGSIPSEIGKSSALELLYLPTNELSGPIPSEVGNLSALTALDLSTNVLSGRIPSEILQLTLLELLHVHTNGLSGPMPSEVGSLTALTSFALSGNVLTGSLSSEIGKLSALAVLYLDHNALSGTVPSEVGKLSPLTILNLSNNALSGFIPSEVGNLIALETLTFDGNTFSGTIPTQFGILSSLELLYSHNNALSGSIPSEIGNLSSLTILSFSTNKLSGSIPSEIGNSSSLEILHLQENVLSGPIPPEVGNLSALNVLTVSTNALSGRIPSEIGKLSALTELFLYANVLSGRMPPEIGFCSALEILQLHNNTLSGQIPSEIGRLDNLQSLKVGGNKLNGTLPSEIGLLTNLETLDLGSNNLGGPLPTQILQLTNLKSLDLSGNRFSEEEINNVMVALFPPFSCIETTVEIVLTTDDWPADTTWEIAAGNGTVVASGGSYSLQNRAHNETVCVPSEACTFTLFDQYADGGPSVEITRLEKVYQINGGFTDKVVVNICA